MTTGTVRASPLSQFWTAYGHPVAELLLPTVIAVAAVSVAGALIASATSKRPFGECLLSVSPFVWLGGVMGLIAGASQESIVGGFVSGILAAVTGLFSYMFAKEADDSSRAILSLAAILLCFSAILGLSLGRIHRSSWDEFKRKDAQWALEHERVDIPAMAAYKRFEVCRKSVSPNNIGKCDALLTG
jgi:uncharacterized membrane protein (UPF0136 family)